MPEATKAKLRELAISLDPVELIEEIRALQRHLVVLTEGGKPEAAVEASPPRP